MLLIVQALKMHIAPKKVLTPIGSFNTKADINVANKGSNVYISVASASVDNKLIRNT